MNCFHFIVDNLYEMPNPVFWKKKKKNISICCLLKIFPRVLNIKVNNKKKCHFYKVIFDDSRHTMFVDTNPVNSYGKCPKTLNTLISIVLFRLNFAIYAIVS